ncbi:hypothetical protein [Streptomyces sp. NPDC092129]|uniref:hypothetical protein n=1 Tax=Streptomyces sp. NPDC092129 TaxID=3366010 RepID=UPI003803513A
MAGSRRICAVRAQELGWHPEHRDMLAMNGDQRLRDLAATGARSTARPPPLLSPSGDQWLPGGPWKRPLLRALPVGVT